jgi:hypothetical protein
MRSLPVPLAWAAALAAPLFALCASAWPLLSAPPDALMGLPGLEAGEHLWSLWAGLRDGPLRIETDRVGWPAPYRWVLGDPLSLLPFALGQALGGPLLGWRLTLAAWALVAGAGAAAMGRRLGLPAGALAAAAVGLAPVQSAGVTGITEAAGVGLTAIALAALPAAAAAGWGALGAGLALGATAWAGPYIALHTALLAPIPALLSLRAAHARGARPAAAARVAGAAALGLALAAPVIGAVGGRAEELPGTASALPEVLAAPGAPRNLLFGLDAGRLLLGGSGPDAAHGGYYGLLMVILAVAGLRAEGRRAAGLGLLAAAATALSLGFFLHLDGALVTAGGRPLALPALALTAAAEAVGVDALGRAPRWYRMAGPGALALTALALAGARAAGARLGGPRGARAAPWICAVILIADHTFVGPLPWPRPLGPGAPPAGYAELPPDAVVAHIPAPDAQSDARAALLVWQAAHGRAMAENPHDTRAPAMPAERAARRLERALRGGDPAQISHDRARLAATGVSWIVHLPAPSADPVPIEAGLGPPAVRSAGLLAWPAAPPR